MPFIIEIIFMLPKLSIFYNNFVDFALLHEYYTWILHMSIIYEYGMSLILVKYPSIIFATPWITALQASLSITNTQSPPKPMSIEPLMPSNHLKLCHPLLLLPSMFPSIRVFSSESALCVRWPKYWSFSFSISPSSEYSGLISFRIAWSKGLSRVFSSTTVQKHQFFGAQRSSQSNSCIQIGRASCRERV